MLASIRKRKRAQNNKTVDLSALSWPELKALAKSRGVSIYKVNRVDLEKALS